MRGGLEGAGQCRVAFHQSRPEASIGTCESERDKPHVAKLPAEDELKPVL